MTTTGLRHARGWLFALIFLASVLVPTGAARGQAEPDPTYPATSLTDAYGNPARDVADEEAGRYTFESGQYGAARRVARRNADALADGPDAAHEAQVAHDALLHGRPKLPRSHVGDVGHPRYTPDWDHDGVFGNSGGLEPDGVGDFDADTDEVLDTAYFRIPCLSLRDPAVVHSRYRSGGCDIEDEGREPYRLGVAHEVKLVNARGLRLDATLWLPPGAVRPAGCPRPGSDRYAERRAWRGCVSAGNAAGRRFPSVVFNGGFLSRQESYGWFATRMAGAGYVVLTWDPAGQGESEGAMGDLFGGTDPSAPDCRYAGACRDVEDVLRWFTGRSITRVPDDGFRVESRLDPATNRRNPALPVLDRSRVAIAGHSMGGTTALRYLLMMAREAGTDGRPLPRVAAAISFSSAHPTRSVVPIQFMTSDYDGMAFGPAFFQQNTGRDGEGLGYRQIKTLYERLRASRDRGALSLLVLEGGQHTDFINQPYIFRTVWANLVAGRYAQAWLDCHLRGSRAACRRATSPFPHLSRALASERDPDGGGPAASRCIRVPDRASLAQTPEAFVAAASGEPSYDCVPG